MFKRSSSPARPVQKNARNWRLGKCRANIQNLRNDGEGTIIVSRIAPDGLRSYASFLVDACCLGVKDTFYRVRQRPAEYAEDIRDMRASFKFHGVPSEEVPYELAHNHIWGSAAYPAKAGIPPHSQFTGVSQFFLKEEGDPSEPAMDIAFGRGGNHFLHTSDRRGAERWIPVLPENVGEGNFDHLYPMGYA